MRQSIIDAGAPPPIPCSIGCERPTLALQFTASLDGFLERLSTKGPSTAVRHPTAVEELDLHAVLAVEQQFRVDAFPILRHRPKALAGTRLAGRRGEMRLPAGIIGH